MNRIILVIFGALFFLLSSGASADVKISQLPLGVASTSASGDSFPYVDTAANTTKRLRLGDLDEVPSLSTPSFCTNKALTGFSSTTGSVTAADTILTAFNKIVGNVAAISAAPVSIGTYDSQSPAANGGTLTSNVLYFQSADATRPGMMSTGTQTIAGAKTFSGGITASVTGTASGNTTYTPNQYGVVLSGAANVMSVLAPNASTAFPLVSGGASANPSWALLSVPGGGSGAATFTNHGVLIGQAAAPFAATAAGSAGQVLQSGGASADPSYSTPTYPSASGSAGKVLRSDGTNNAYSTFTIPDTAAQYDLLYASAANVWASLAKANSSALVTNSSGVPSWAAGTVANRLLRTDGTSVAFAQAVLTTDVSGTLPLGNGGTGATSFTNHGVMLGQGSSALAVTAAGAGGTVLQGVASSDPAFSATPTLGIAGTTKGTLAFAGNTSGTVTVQPAAAAGTWTLTWPTDDGTDGQVLTTNGSGVTSWTSASGGGGLLAYGEAYFATTASCIVSKTGGALGAFGTQSACPGPTLVQQGGGTLAIQNTDANTPTIVTVNSVPAGTCQVEFHGFGDGNGAATDLSFSVNDGTTTSDMVMTNTTTTNGSYFDAYAIFVYGASGNKTFELYGATNSGTIRVYNLNNTYQRTLFRIKCWATPA